MPSPLVIPGVQVRTEFEPSPVIPGATGILGIVGITDRGPIEPTPVGNFGEFIELFGPASRYSMPEVRTAFANGVSQVFVARIEPGKGTKASLELLDSEGEKVARLEARAEGKWAEKLKVRVTQVKALSGKGVKYVNLEVLLNDTVIETHNNLVMDETSPDYFFRRINQQSRVLVAVDPLFEKGLPSTIPSTPLTEAEPAAAFALLKAGDTDVIRVEAKRAGRAGNRSAVQVHDGQAGLSLTGAGDAPSVLFQARKAGTEGTQVRVAVSGAGPDSVNVVVTPQAGSPRPYGPFNDVAAIVSGLANDPDVEAVALGSVLPSAQAATPLARRVTVEVTTEGRDTRVYTNLATLDEIAAITDPVVAFSKVDGATQLPDSTDGAPLTGGRDRSPALRLKGEDSEEPLLEITPAPGVTANISVGLTEGVSTIDGTTPVVNLNVFVDNELAESYTNLTMDPDDPNYLPEVLESSGLIRGIDLFVRSRTTSFPASIVKAKPLTGGAAPLPDDYQSALERLEQVEEVDLVIASVGNQLDDAAQRTVHQAVVAHCTKMADVARNRIGIGAVTASESANVNQILDHANDVRSDHFILAAPTGMEGAIAGLLGRQDFFQSPTFKTIASPDATPGTYTDAQLTQLINGNVLVVNERRRLGVIVVKGLLTSGRQINVQRTANKCVREVKAISDKYIGLLNNEGARNALRQQIIALFLQMERDGALVPSTDGKDPAFRVDVYSTQADFAQGIVRVDIAVRPVRAIDYIYATILVKN
jgi:Phage tail sheath protein.